MSYLSDFDRVYVCEFVSIDFVFGFFFVFVGVLLAFHSSSESENRTRFSRRGERKLSEMP